jgi:hypothetical protein
MDATLSILGSKPTHLIVILEGLWYARIDPIQFIGPQSIVWTTHVLTITKDVQNIMPMYSQAKPIKEASNLFSKKAIVSIVFKTTIGIRHIRSLSKIHSRK